MKKKLRISLIISIALISFTAFLISCNLSDIIPDIDIGSIWEVFGYNKPANLQALAVSDSQIYLSWEDKVTGEDGFKLEYSTDFVNYTAINIEKNTTEYYHKPLSASTWFFYRMYAYDASGNSKTSNDTGAMTKNAPEAAPEDPTNLQAQVISDTRIELSWDDNSTDEDGFKVYRSTDDSTYDLIDTTDPNITEYTDTGLTQSTLYYYKVLAYNSFNSDADDSTAAGPASATTEAAPVSVPADPTNLQAAAISNMRIDLSWADNSDNEEAFIVQISSDGSTFSTIGEVKPNVTTFQSTSLKPETKYYYRVYATNSYDPFMSGYTNTASATTKPTPGTVPAAPTNLQAKAASDTQIKIGWTDNSTDEDGFNVLISKDDIDYYWMAKVKPNETVYLVGGLPVNYTFYFKVSAFNFFGESALSAAASATTLSSGTPPAAPTNLVAKTVSDTQIAIGWYDNSDNEDGFNVFISKDEGLTYDWWDKVEPDTREYLVSGLPPNNTFYFKVNAYNKYGAPELSEIEPASATTGASPEAEPAPPTNLVAKAASDTAIAMEWTDKSDNEDGFNIEVSGDGIRFEFLEKVGPDENRYYLGGLKPNLTLYFRVNAFNREGKSDYSNIAKATTLPEAGDVPADPTGLFANVVSYAQIALGWSDNSKDEDGFNIEWNVDKENTGVEPASDDSGWEYFEKVPPDTEEYLAEGLYPDITFWFRVRAYNKIGPSLNYSNAAGGKTPVAPTDPPLAPTNLAARAVSDTVIELRWSDNSGDEDAFYIEIYKGVEEPPDEKFELYKKVAPNTTGFAVEGLVEKTPYWFRVYAANSGGDSYSNNATATTNSASVDPPAEPKDLIANALSDTQIGLGWTDNSGDEDGFNIYKGLTEEEFVYDGQVGAGETKYVAEGLTEQTTYFFMVRAFNGSGESLDSNIEKDTTLPASAETPAAPEKLEAEAASDTVIELRWIDVSDNEDGFYIDRSTDGAKYVRIAKLDAGSVYYAAKGLTPSTQYWFKVVAYNGDKEAASTAATETTNDPFTETPDAPFSLSATTLSSKAIGLSWADNSGNEDGFNILMAEEDEKNPGNPGEYKWLFAVKANETKCEIDRLQAATPYWFLINAFNKFGNSDDSGPASATTNESPEFPPLAPDNLAAEALGDLVILLTWTDKSTVEEAFFIQRSTNGIDYKNINSVREVEGSEGEGRYKDGGLTDGETYHYKVYATNSAGDSDPCDPASATAVKELK